MTKVSVIIPAFNEERTIAEVVERVQATDISPLEKEIIVVDNNSTDKTNEIAKTFGTVQVMREQTPGKGAAVRAGFSVASGDILLIQDADLEYDPSDFPALLAPFEDSTIDMVLGVRIRDTSVKRSPLHYLGNWSITTATNLLYGASAEEYTGGYKLFRKSALVAITVHTNDFAYEHELVCKLLKRDANYREVPIRYIPRDYTRGKKINWKDGFKILWAVIKYRFVE